MSFHVKQPDIVKCLRDLGRETMRFGDVFFHAADEIEQLRQELFKLGEESKEWQNRYWAEQQDHEATMKAWDEALKAWDEERGSPRHGNS